MKYRIAIPGNPPLVIMTSDLEQLGEAIKRFIEYGYRDGEISWNGIVITECAESTDKSW